MFIKLSNFCFLLSFLLIKLICFQKPVSSTGKSFIFHHNLQKQFFYFFQCHSFCQQIVTFFHEYVNFSHHFVNNLSLVMLINKILVTFNSNECKHNIFIKLSFKMYKYYSLEVKIFHFQKSVVENISKNIWNFHLKIFMNHNHKFISCRTDDSQLLNEDLWIIRSIFINNYIILIGKYLTFIPRKSI